MQLSLLNRTALFSLLLTFAGCKEEVQVDRSTGALEPAQRAQSEGVTVTPYPRARWRLVNPIELDHVVLWVSQIVVRHGESNTDPAFAMADWHSGSPGGQRSRAEAFAIAQELHAQVANAPGRFAELARLHSEDAATQALGGSLGGITASQLGFWGNVLDALAATPPGQISRVVETPYGFHILQRRPAPPEDTVSGAHVVISHAEAGWIKILGKTGEGSERSRADALALATQLYEKARENPDEFDELVERHSEHRDASRGGDMGTWSTREPTFYPREVEILAGLAVGEVAPPVDSPVGFQIIRRVPNRPRERLAMAPIRLSFDPLRQAPDPAARASVLAQAMELSQLLRTAPSRFAELQAEICCLYPEHWLEGRGSPALTTALSRLEPGQIADEPILSEHSYVIPKRIEPPAQRPVATRYDLPDPDAPDILSLVGGRDGAFLRDELRSLGEEVIAGLPLPEPTAKQVTDLHGSSARFQGLETPESRVAAFNTLMNDVKGLLGPETYPRYLALVAAHFEGVLLKTW